jgi:hypothetical protein
MERIAHNAPALFVEGFKRLKISLAMPFKPGVGECIMSIASINRDHRQTHMVVKRDRHQLVSSCYLISAGLAVRRNLTIDNQRLDVGVEWLNVSDKGCLNYAIPMLIGEF